MSERCRFGAYLYDHEFELYNEIMIGYLGIYRYRGSPDKYGKYHYNGSKKYVLWEKGTIARNCYLFIDIERYNRYKNIVNSLTVNFNELERRSEKQKNLYYDRLNTLIANILDEESFIHQINKAIEGIKRYNNKLSYLIALKLFIKERKPELYAGTLEEYQEEIKKEISKYIDWNKEE